MIHVLCGTTAGPEAGREARWADDLAQVLHGDLELVTAGTRRSAEEAPETSREFDEEVAEELARWAAQRHVDDAELVTSEQAPDVALTGEADASHAFAVVIGSAPDEGATSLGLGSLAHRLAHRLNCPLIVVPPGDSPLTGALLVIGVDGSDGSEQALRWGSSLAARIGGDPVAVFSIDAMYETFGSRGYYGPDERSARRQVRHVAPGVEFVEGVGADPAETLRAVAVERNSALIVVAARGRHGLGGMLLGRVPDHLLHHPVRPVAVIPHGYSHPTASPRPYAALGQR